MKNAYYLIGIILLLVILVFSGCGVAQEEYDAVLAERDAALVEIAGLEDDLEASQDEVAGLEDDLEAFQNEVADLEDVLEDAQDEVAGLEDDLEDAQVEITGLLADLDKALDDLVTLESEMTSAITPVIARITLASCLLELESLAARYEMDMISLQDYASASLILFFSLAVLCDACDDEQLSQHSDEFWEAFDKEQDEEATCCLIEIYDRLIELLAQDLEALESLTD